MFDDCFPLKLKIKCIRQWFDINRAGAGHHYRVQQRPSQNTQAEFYQKSIHRFSSIELLHLNCDLLPGRAQLALSRTFCSPVADNSF